VAHEIRRLPSEVVKRQVGDFSKPLAKTRDHFLGPSTIRKERIAKTQAMALIAESAMLAG
jgi:hypothetical protein